MVSTLRGVISVALLTTACAVVRAQQDRPASAAGVEFFEKRIRPLLVENCQECHGVKKQESGLVLINLAGILKGGDRGNAIVAGDPEQSLLIQAVRYTDDDLKMPPRGKLKEEQIADLIAWVKMGAPGPRDGGDLVAVRPSNDFNLAQRRQHWAYQPVQNHALPTVEDRAWCASPIDYFIRAKLENSSLAPSAPAEKRTLIRRLTFDLIGLPPSPTEVTEFLKDSSPDAYDRLVDRLLASPQHGERWGRHWLDVVRYCETLGFEFDYDLYNAWRYRDYVIRALNADLPYDQFVIEHLAGDLLPNPRRYWADGCNESILATGFFWMLEGKQTPVDIRQEQADRIDNQIDTLGKAFLAQTIACARCHDHKFDAISTRDYYALAGYLKSSRFQQAFIDPPERAAAQVQQLRALRAEIIELAPKHLAAKWKEPLSQASRYLLAAQNPKLRVLKTEGEGRRAEQRLAVPAAALDEVARATGLDAPTLEKWVKAITPKEPFASDHPLYAWAQMAADDDATSEGVKQRREAFIAALPKQDENAARAAASAQSFVNFQVRGFGDWYLSANAFGDAPVRTGEVVIGESAARPIARLATGGADSGRLSERLQGELRSASFTLSKPYVHVRLAGSRGRVNLVIDGYTLIMNPMYGKLTAAPAGNVPMWRTMPVDRWIGHRAYVEVSDCTIPMHGLNPPPSNARVPESKGDGHIVLEQVAFSDDPEPPTILNRAAKGLIQRSADEKLESLAAAYQELMLQTVERWGAGKLDVKGDDAGRLFLLNWLLENGLLDSDEVASGDNIEGSKLAELLVRYRELSASLPIPQRAPALADGTGEDEFVFLRGNYRALGERAVRGPPDALCDPTVAGTLRVPSPVYGTRSVPTTLGSGRLDLAEHLVDPANPVLPRVIVNRLWQHHFGEGIVRSPDDFGRMGQPPTHPELLDYLAEELVRGDWSLKAMHRRMVTSSAYGQGSGVRSQESEEDPENRLLHRMPVRRLEAEAIRDSMLAVSDRLTGTQHGPSVLPFLTQHMEGRGRPNSGALDSDGRRSIYINSRRNFLTPLLLAFDYPVTFTAIGRRGSATIPAQALTLMNDPLVVQQAGQWANRALDEGGSTMEQKIEWLYQSAFARPPSEQETRDAIDFLQEQSLRHGGGSNDQRVWADLCHVLMNVKEFIFIP